MRLAASRPKVRTMAATIRQGPPKQERWPSAHPRRLEERVQATLQLVLRDGSAGMTRDISPSGIYFWSAEVLGEGDAVRFTVRFQDPYMKRRWTLYCNGRVLRVERVDGRCGVAARILDSKLETFC